MSKKLCVTKPLCQTLSNTYDIIEMLEECSPCDLTEVIKYLICIVQKIDNLQKCCDELKSQFNCEEVCNEKEDDDDNEDNQ